MSQLSAVVRGHTSSEEGKYFGKFAPLNFRDRDNINLFQSRINKILRSIFIILKEKHVVKLVMSKVGHLGDNSFEGRRQYLQSVGEYYWTRCLYKSQGPQ